MTKIKEGKQSDVPAVRKSPRPRNAPLKSILTQRQTGAFHVIYRGQDLTPEPLHPATYDGLWSQRLKKTKPAEPTLDPDVKKPAFSSSSKSRLQSELQRQTIQAESVFKQSYASTIHIDEIVIQPEEGALTRNNLINDLTTGSKVPRLEVPKAMPTDISLVLAETPTIFFFELPSKTVEKTSEEGPEVEAANERYLYLTEGKGRNRKVVHTEVQTVPTLLKTRGTEAEKASHKHNHAFASNWDMYDTYKLKFEYQEVEKKEFSIDPDDRKSADDPNATLTNEEQMTKLLQNPRFQDALCVIERLLANNNFNEQQKRFRGLSDPNPFREDIEYKYRLDLLWTFANKETFGRCVTSICWNAINSDVLAVGYGKFYYTEQTTGMIFLWNIKNPVQPERIYRFEEPVTALDFSKQHPNLLAIGFYDGSILVIDVSDREIRIIAKTGFDSPSFEPVWQVKWQEGNDYYKGEEMILSTNEDGRVNQYRLKPSIYLLHSLLMHITQPQAKMKGIEVLRKCHVPGIPVTRYSAGLILQQHPVEPDIYYVGTNEGTIHKCSKNYFHQHLDLFLAHEGAIYEMKFSKFCNRVYLTCGDDWYVRIWVEGIIEPLFDLSKTMNSVQGADWSPTFSTIIANISGTDIYIWDLQRKTHLPQSITPSPTNCRNTVVQFTENGRCLVVGDIEGNVHIFSLEDMPFPAFFQDDLLINSIIRGLITRPDLIKKLKKFDKLSFDDENQEKRSFLTV